jgi:CRP-like cAMP-binding protein
MPTSKNDLLEILPRRERSRFLARCETVGLVMSEVLCEPGSVARHVYFPIDGFISLITSIDGKPVLEVGMVGSEGMLGAQIATGVRTQPLHALVQGTGESWRVSVGDFREELSASAPLQKLVDRYLYVIMAQLATAAGCLRFHTITRRLARWLLMTQDRAHSDSFHVTHEFLSYMLGVRREGVTTSAGELHAAGLIRYSRGEVVVLDRSGLERASCSCYEVDRQSYLEVLR